MMLVTVGMAATKETRDAVAQQASACKMSGFKRGPDEVASNTRVELKMIKKESVSRALPPVASQTPTLSKTCKRCS